MNSTRALGYGLAAAAVIVAAASPLPAGSLSDEQMTRARAIARKNLTELAGMKITIPLVKARAPVRRRTVSLTVDDPTGLGRAAWPVRLGIPIPRGQLRSPTNVRLLNAAGVELPVGARALAHWLPGQGADHESVKWLLLDFQADVPAGAGGAAYALEYGTQVTAKFTEPLRVTTEAGKLTIRTRGMEVQLPVSGAPWVSQIRIDADRNGRFDRGESLLGDGGIDGFLEYSVPKVSARMHRMASFERVALGLEATRPTAARTALPLKIKSVRVVERGPVQVTVRLDGLYAPDKITEGCVKYPVTVFLRVYREGQLVRLRHHWVFAGIAERDHLRRYGLRVALAGKGPKQVRFGVEGADPVESAVPPAGKLSIAQTGQRRFAVVGSRGKEVATGVHADGSVRIAQGPTGGFQLVLRDMWENYPNSLQVDRAGGRLTVNLFGGRAEQFLDLRINHPRYKANGTATGVGKSHTMYLAFGRAAGQAKLAALVDRPCRAFAGVDWYADSRALGFYMPYHRSKLGRAYGQYRGFYVDMFLMHTRPYHRLYGFLDYGAPRLYMPPDMKGFHRGRNKEWIVGYGRVPMCAVIHSLASGRRIDWDFVEGYIQSLTDVQTCHTDWNKGKGMKGKGYRHNWYHWGDGPAGDRQFDFAAQAVYYLLTGDPWVRQTIDDFAGSVLDGYKRTGAGFFHHGSTAQRLENLLYLSETTGKAVFRRIAAEQMRFLTRNHLKKYATIQKNGGWWRWKWEDGNYQMVAPKEGKMLYQGLKAASDPGVVGGYFLWYAGDDGFRKYVEETGDREIAEGLLLIANINTNIKGDKKWWTWQKASILGPATWAWRATGEEKFKSRVIRTIAKVGSQWAGMRRWRREGKPLVTPEMTRQQAIAFCEKNFGSLVGGEFASGHGFDIPYALYAIHQHPELEKLVTETFFAEDGWSKPRFRP